MIPLVHDLSDDRVLIFGGGAVGARKARRFAREATVLVVSPTFGEATFGDAQLVRAAPSPESAVHWLERVDPALVVIATDDPELNAAVDAAARELGILRNRADQAGSRDAGSVVVPATARDDPVVAAVSTGGHSPALSRHLREHLEDAVDGAGAMARLTADLREEVPGPDRSEALRAVITSEEVWKALDTEGANPRQVARDVIADVTGDSG